MVLTVILFCTPNRLPEQTPDKSENKQYTVAPMSSPVIAETKTVSAAIDASSEIPATVEIIISTQTEDAPIATHGCLDATEGPVEDDGHKPDITATEPASPPQPSSSGLPGFDFAPYAGPNTAIKADDMYENGNKIGTMGDISKQVGIMD